MVESANSCKCMLIIKIVFMIPFIPMVRLELLTIILIFMTSRFISRNIIKNQTVKCDVMIICNGMQVRLKGCLHEHAHIYYPSL